MVWETREKLYSFLRVGGSNREYAFDGELEIVSVELHIIVEHQYAYRISNVTSDPPHSGLIQL